MKVTILDEFAEVTEERMKALDLPCSHARGVESKQGFILLWGREYAHGISVYKKQARKMFAFCPDCGQRLEGRE